ncbi:nucleotide sugar epimerase [Salipiger pallidus]|uniref:Nucleotide sugar epimerase n=1 Tax=Salipiger pallidus TaxID=1775170 RepID=A0A8J2ZJG2_9RHOB|nr:nucleoside-diphosphate sugar epimerase/dehydratase [Salipiger pallidus]GGG69819.1 nucleotide sugar epimerase [Salipiger pallidus]
MLYWLVTSLTRTQKQLLFMLADALSIILAMIAALLLHAVVNPDIESVSGLMLPLAMMVLLGGAVSWWLGLPHLKLNAYDTRGITRSAYFAAITGLAGVAFSRFGTPQLALPVYFNFSLLLLVTCVGWRIMMRYVTLEIYRRGGNRMRVIIYGAGQTGQQLALALRHDNRIDPVAFVDDNPTMQSQVVAGLKVHASSAIQDLISKKSVQRVVLAMPSISPPQTARIAHGLRKIGVEVHALPSFAQMVGEGELRKRVTPVSLDDLLGRNRLESQLPGVSHAYTGRRIMVTGAGGSIGSELCRQLIACKPDCVVLVDHSELSLYNIEKELRETSQGMSVVPILGSILDESLMSDVMAQHDIEVVLHAAAYKHLPLVECNVLAGLRNNVLGTKVLADCAREAGVERFILVSSDKAVRPTNVMGASKRLAELVVQDLATRSTGTRFSMVRFGNVLGSSGSVIPLFEEQIARGGPVTLTDPKVTRFFMTISEAARLVLLAGSFARGGDVFVLDMGKPVAIRKLARQMIEGAGYTVKDEEHPEGDIEIKVTGLRKGEKMHEELLISSDMLTTPHQKILRAQESYLSEFELATALKDLRMAISSLDEEMARGVIARWVEQGEKPAVEKQRV